MGYSTYLDLVPIIERPRVSPNVAQEQPYLEIPGGIQGVVSTDARADSSALFPALVDTTSTDEQPANFNAPSASDFLSWHTAWQVTELPRLNPTGLSVTLFSDASQITAFLGDGVQSNRVFVVQNLQKSDIGMMTKRTQERLSSLTDWSGSGGMAERYGYTTSGSIASQRAALKSILQTTYKDAMTAPSGSVMTDADVKLFTRQIDNISTRLDNSSVFNTAAIKSAAEDILTRYQRAAAFAIKTTVNDAGDPIEGQDMAAADTLQVGGTAYYPDKSITPKTISMDGNQYINKGYKKFISEEKRILQADNAQIKLASLVAAQPKSVDLPRLIFYMQMNEDLQKNRESIANTEELKQQNRYIQDIGIFQRLINRTVGTFGTGTNETRTLLNTGGPYLTENYFALKTLTKEEMLSFSMFEKENTDLSYLGHPIETLRNLPKRPTLSLLTPTNTIPSYGTTWVGQVKSLPRTTWENYATMLSDYVNTVNMETSMKQNENQALDQEKNRHYQLASNCISKMFDMLQSIARS